MEQTRPIWKSVLFGTVAALIAMLLLSLIAALLIHKSVLPESSAHLVGVVITILSSFIGGVVAGRIQRSKMLLTCLGSGVGFVLVVLSAKAAFIGEWESFKPMIALAALASGLASSFMPTGQGRHRKRR